MSKKDKLKAQAQKQAVMRKELEEEERLEREEAKRKQSRSAKKMLRKTKYGRYGKEPAAFMILRILMIFPFMYSGFFYGGVVVFGIIFERIEPAPPQWVLWFTLSGTLLILAGIIIEFFRKHIASFAVTAGGTVLFLKAAQYFIDRIRDRLDKVYVEEALRDMDTVYVKRYYPIIGTLILSFVIMITSIILKIIHKKKIQRLKDTAPVKSVVD